MDLKAVVVASVQGRDLSLHELLTNLKVKGRLRPLLTEAILEKIIGHAIEQEGLKVSTEELQKAADAFRINLGLNKAADLKRWLVRNNLTPAELENGLERTLLTQKLADKVVSADAVEKFFAENRTRFDRARLAHLVVEQEGLARELLSQLQEEGADFAEMAREHSLDERTRSRGGSLGLVSRKRLNPAIEAVVSVAKKGDVVGPFKLGPGYQVLKVEDIILGQLDQRTRAAIRRLLFRGWLRDRARVAHVDVKLQQHL